MMRGLQSYLNRYSDGGCPIPFLSALGNVPTLITKDNVLLNEGAVRGLADPESARNSRIRNRHHDGSRVQGEGVRRV